MYKKVTADLVIEKVKKLHRDGNWRKKVCLLVLLLLSRGKLASKYFVFDKIEEWELWGLFFNKEISAAKEDKASILLAISKTLHNLFLDGYLRKEDLARRSLSQKGFEKICKNRILGKPEHPRFPNKTSKNPEQPELQSRWIQSAYYLSPKGRKEARDILFPSKKRALSCKFSKFNSNGGNRKPNACA